MTDIATLPSAAERVASTPLIPRDALFGNPSRAAGTISRDGKWLGWLAPLDGVMNVWIAPTDDPSAARPMTHSTDRPIPMFFFAPLSDSVLYAQDKAGDENYLLYQVDIASGEERTLTPFESKPTRVTPSSFPDKAHTDCALSRTGVVLGCGPPVTSPA